MPENRQSILTLHRYFIWANRMRSHFDAIISKGPITATAEIESVLYMSYWYAALFVVIEGWQKLKLVDDAIDGLLQSPNVALLRRYRNGVFHFQPAYNDARFKAFYAEEAGTVEWVRSLNHEFGRYFLAFARQNAP